MSSNEAVFTDRFPRCCHCKRIILGEAYQRRFDKKLKKASPRYLKKEYDLCHRECASSELPANTTCPNPQVEHARCDLENTFTLYADIRKAEDEAKMRLEHEIWLYYLRKSKDLKSYRLCSGPFENESGSPCCYVCGQMLIGESFTFSQSRTSFTVRRLGRLTRGMHQDCAKKWVNSVSESHRRALPVSIEERNLEQVLLDKANVDKIVAEKTARLSKAIEGSLKENVVILGTTRTGSKVPEFRNPFKNKDSVISLTDFRSKRRKSIQERIIEQIDLEYIGYIGLKLTGLCVEVENPQYRSKDFDPVKRIEEIYKEMSSIMTQAYRARRMFFGEKDDPPPSAS